MTYPLLVRFPKKIQKDLLMEKCEIDKVSVSSVMVDLASKYVKGEIQAKGEKISDINKRNRKKLVYLLDKDITV